ncbi:MAG: hypothetical protein ACI8Z7_001007 [Candidatus Nanohaloarchaea archaeon]
MESNETVEKLENIAGARSKLPKQNASTFS